MKERSGQCAILLRLIAIGALAALPANSAVAAGPPPTASETILVAPLAASVDARFADGYSEVDGLKLHYVSGGTGPAVLLIPGWLQTWYAWRAVMPALADAGYHVVVVDPQGMGQSDRPASGYDTGHVANELNGVMQKLGYSRYSVVGHDIGMWVGYALAADHPREVKDLSLVEAIIPGLLKKPPEVFMPQAQSAFFWQFMFNQQPDLPEMLIAGRERQFIAYLFGKWAYRPERIALPLYSDAYSSPGGIRAQMDYYRAFPETISQNVVRANHKLPMPVLALGGDHGVRDYPMQMMQPVTEHLTGGVLKDCGHFAPEECPSELSAKLVAFLDLNRQREPLK